MDQLGSHLLFTSEFSTTWRMIWWALPRFLKSPTTKSISSFTFSLFPFLGLCCSIWFLGFITWKLVLEYFRWDFSCSVKIFVLFQISFFNNRLISLTISIGLAAIISSLQFGFVFLFLRVFMLFWYIYYFGKTALLQILANCVWLIRWFFYLKFCTFDTIKWYYHESALRCNL